MDITETETASIVLAAVVLLLSAVQIIWFWRRRANLIIRARGAWSVFMTALGLMLVVLASGVLGGGLNLQCIIPASVLYLGVAIASVFLLERYVYLYICYAVLASHGKVLASAEIVSDNNNPHVLEAQIHELQDEIHSGFERKLAIYFLKHRLTFEQFRWPKILALAIALGFTAGAIVLFVSITPDSSNFYDALCQESISKAFVVLLGCLYPSAIFRIFLHFKFRRVRESYFIKQELNSTACFLLWLLAYSTVASLAFSSLNDSFTGSYIGITYLIHGITLPFALVICSVGVVLVRIYARRLGLKNAYGNGQIALESNVQIEATPAVLTLNVLLSDAEMCQVYQQFLTKEFSVENLLLWKAIEVFRWKYQTIDHQDLSMARATALKMYRAFCSPNARLQVNISAERQRAVEEFFNSEQIQSAEDEEFVRECVRMYTELQQDIYDLMKEDSFKRFLKSEEFDLLRRNPDISRRFALPPSTH
eukprot:TRINITY_DN12735_c0_g2_i1.p1 TRINITY_DN12735_c0_g2~~TRINITY_DN12735_c0_g2_i1.p1  ORF type:complete len:480 (+),score=108.20 TRINITY_DN12735_c0_g2_i1:52-1491(+)